MAFEVSDDNETSIINNNFEESILYHKGGKDFKKIRAEYNISKDTFIVDSGATSHMRCSKEGMSDLQTYKIPVKVGNAMSIYSEMVGTFKGKVLQKDGRIINIILKDVLYIPDLCINLFSLTKVLDNPQVDIKKEKQTMAIYNNLLYLLCKLTLDE